MLLSMISLIVNAAYGVVLNLDLYTDRAPMPNGGVREWKRSPITRLNISGQSALLYLEIAFAVVSVVTSILVLFGLKSRAIRIVQLVSTAASTVMFIIIMIVTGNSHVNYA